MKVQQWRCKIQIIWGRERHFVKEAYLTLLKFKLKLLT